MYTQTMAAEPTTVPRSASRAQQRGSATRGALVVLLSSLLLHSGCTDGAADGAPHGQAPAVTVQTLRIEPVEIPLKLTAVGSLASPQTTQISAEFAGKVVFLDIPEGQEVEKGHILARLDERRAAAALTIALARHQNAKERLVRLRQLRSAGVISEQEFDDAIAELDGSTGQLADARTALGKAAISAPFAGILGLRQVSVGAYVDPGDPIVRLTQIDPLDMIFSLPQRHVSQIEAGMTVNGVAGSCEQRFAGVITVIDPDIDPDTRSIRVQARVSNDEGRLRPGMAAALAVQVGHTANALLVPQEAIVREGTRTLLYTLNDDSTTTSREVTLGTFFDDAVEVTEGLDAGATVVTAGQQKLRPALKVVAQPHQPTDNPNVTLGSTGFLEECHF